jgi:hypothetical protein
MGRSHPFATSSRNDRYLRIQDGGSRRIADVAGHGVGRLNWARGARTRVASGRTGVRAEAAIPLRAQNKLHRLRRKFRLRNRTAGRLARNHANICFYP